jgi:(E)-4-hydroxy-3-methylbut-2-enyl-diphosphate synthase
MGDNAVISSVAALSILLNEGIGDTIRVSLTPDKMGIRTKEVEVCKDILSSLNLKQFKPKVISCPGCGRTSSNYFIDLTKDINKHIDNNMLEWKSKYIGVENINIAVMGCIVNGPGESKHANIGISLPGTNESPSAPVFIDGEKVTTLKGDHIRDDFIKLVEEYISKKYKKVS